VTFTPADPVVSGKPYTVVEVGDRAPKSIDDFIGETGFVLEDGPTGGRRVTGVGSADGDNVKFREKDVSGSSKDVRMWRVRESGDGGFIAEASATY
jgi:hypothetical protein